MARDRHYPWRVLVCCALLNRTGRAQVRPMFEELFASYPTPGHVVRGAPMGRSLSELLRPLGLWRRREALLVALSEDYAAGKPVQDCRGVGRYALDARAIFVEGRTDVRPTDHFLKPYLTWKKRHAKRNPEAAARR